jgi:hypothetical protein
MQIIELYIKGYNRLEGRAQGTATVNLLTDSQATFTTTVSVGDLVENLTTQESSYVVSITNDTNVVLSASIFPDATLTYEYRITSPYFRADLFEDESISITETLLNVKDIGKVFTPFSQQFNLPASKLNNKLFRHYENQDILNSFDARYRNDAIIKLNGIDYKKGKIQFKSVSLKDNKPHAYKVVFFGDTVELKEILGETTLGGLDYGSDLDFEYTQQNITNFSSLPDSSINSIYGSTDILVPNIQHSKNMRYSTTNGYKDAITDTGLLWTDLKPAIRLRAIIEAIERRFPRINFFGYFNETKFNQFYMWLHRNEGYVTNAVEGGGTRILRNRWYDLSVPDYSFTSGTELRPATLTPPSYSYFWNWRYKVEVDINVGGSTIPYKVRIKNASTEEEYYAHDYPSGGDSLTFAEIPFSVGSGGFLDLMIEVESDSTIAMSQTLTVRLQHRTTFNPTFFDEEVGVYTPTNQSTENTFYIGKQIPNIKVMDFLSGLFKMFNLLVFKSDDQINVFEARAYMNAGADYDITKYVDMSSSNVERLFQYKRMDFKFKSKESFLVQFSDEIQGIPFAEEDYGNDEWDGGVYKVEVPFEKMMYERLSDEAGNQTYIGQGAMLDKDFNPTIGEPLILCIAYQENTDDEFTLDGSANSHYRRPTQLTTFDWGYSTRQQLSFGEEKDEWLGVIPSDTTNLFQYGYLDYVHTVFDRNSRLVKVTAYLPLSLLIKLNMNDTLVINNKAYRVNSIKTNLLTNKSDLELYNVDEWVSQINNSQFAYLDRVAQVTSTSKTSTSIDITWTAVTGAVGYDVILNGGVFVTTLGNAIKILPLEPNTTYNIGVRAKYNIDGNDAYSFDTSIVVTTDPPPVALAEDGDTLITEVGDTIILE